MRVEELKKKNRAILKKNIDELKEQNAYNLNKHIDELKKTKCRGIKD